MQTTKVREPGLFFLDSGAHSLYNLHVYNHPEVMARPLQQRYGYYDTKEFWTYVDAYAAFVKEHVDVIDYYANVDVIYHPERSWKVQRYLEDKHGLQPVPVVHWGADLKWVRHYLKRGYELLGIGGLGQGATKAAYIKWCDAVFATLCPPPECLPLARTHGFAMTSYDLMLRYPWWSVDSASWTKVGAYGNILVPHKRGGKFVFTEQPYVIAVSQDSPDRKLAGRHVTCLAGGTTGRSLEIVKEWLREVGIAFGETASDGTIIEFGVTNRHAERKIANLLFFERMRLALPEYPWPFRINVGEGFGL